jgi:nitroreductase
MQAIDALLKRRSAKSLVEPAPDEGALELIFEAAARAPDHGRLRPWRFIVIGGAARGRFGDLLAEHLRRTHPSTAEETLQRERQKAFRAPLIVVVAAICNPSSKVPVIEQVLAAGAAAQNIMLASFALGFGAMWKTGGPAYDEQVKSALGLAPKDAIVGFLYLGTDTAGQAGAAPGVAASAPGASSPSAAFPRTPWRDLVQRWDD